MNYQAVHVHVHVDCAADRATVHIQCTMNIMCLSWQRQPKQRFDVGCCRSIVRVSAACDGTEAESNFKA